ncbi:hypothetical protein A2Z00_01875 [Candidatus Gottesmanbacteria bacterium RBG_13_45_10]|uniref:Peptidase M50 domain-containing protein n=1 Tax=Candidatus Gottesmanbacteria bacterium RBG_13_45_10 TaxID=1798370 RepID=A0A1F5ZH05_9BACT|nr:MAG: hypothetical protein A2Z00_01875 [Candidatus Gottesmanbacteria bacterium RBG_13_45_10]
MFGIASNPIELIFSLLALIVAISVHEFSHAYAAERLGDPTPRLMGRLTLNPLAHLDPIGTILLVLFRFGWGKPVQFDPFNLRNPRRDSAIISLAGPFSNFITATASAILIHLLATTRFALLSNSSLGVILYLVVAFLESLVVMNIVLGVFNLVPVHPLDGFKVVGGILPEEYAKQWNELERYGMIFLIFLIFPLFGGQSAISRIISPIINIALSILLPGVPVI